MNKNQTFLRDIHADLPEIMDITKTAKLLIMQLDRQAYDHAIERVEFFERQEDIKGSYIWKAIAQDIKYLIKRRKPNLRLIINNR